MVMIEARRCTKCIFPDIYPDITFNDLGDYAMDFIQLPQYIERILLERTTEPPSLEGFLRELGVSKEDVNWHAQ